MYEETKKAPAIRFQGFTDDWEQRKLGEVFFQTSKYVNPKESNLELWSLTVENGLTPKTERYNREFLVKKEDQFKSVDHNEFIYNPMNMTLGAVDLNLTGKTVAVSGYYITMLSKDGFDSKYFSIWLKSPLAIKMYKLYATGSLIERQRVQFPTLSQIKSSVPQIEEQTKIGSFFKQLDDTIALHQRKLTLLEQLKQTYLQQMFPQDENNFPVLRIAGFSQPWVLRRLSDVSERVRGNDGRMDLPTLTISAGSGWLDQRERFSGNIAGNEQKNYTLLSNGELSYNHGNSKLAKYGVVFALRTFEEALVPKVYHSFKTTDEASADFIEYMFATKTPDRELAKLVSSGARMDGLLNINYDEFMGIDIMVPEIDEQNRISHFLRKFDDTIVLHRCKIEKLTELKKVLLAKMFL